MINETDYKKLTVKKVNEMDGFLVNVNLRSFYRLKLNEMKNCLMCFDVFKCRLLFYYGILELWLTINTDNTTQICKIKQPLTAEYLLLMLLIRLRSLTIR